MFGYSEIEHVFLLVMVRTLSPEGDRIMIQQREIVKDRGGKRASHIKLVYVNPAFVKGSNKEPVHGQAVCGHSSGNMIIGPAGRGKSVCRTGVSKNSAWIRQIALGLSLLLGMGLILFIATASLPAGTAVGTESNEINLIFKPVVVQEGESLWRLCSQAGLDVSTEILIGRTLKYNGLQGTCLTAGQTIYIPCGEAGADQ